MPAPPQIFDRELVAQRLARRRPEDDFVSRLVLEDLAERLLTITRPFTKALIMAPDGRVLPMQGQSAEGTFAYDRVSSVMPGPLPLVDAERLELPQTGYNLIASVLDMTVVNDVPGFLARVRAHLAPDGLFLGAALGGDTLTELRRAYLAADAEVLGGAYARVAPFLQLGDAGPLLQRTGFALPVTDIEAHTIRYRDPLALMRDLKALGASNPLAERPPALATPRLMATAAQAYAKDWTDPDGRIRATLQIVWLSGWTPHESQQQPLRPGSAKVSLAEVLGKKPS